MTASPVRIIDQSGQESRPGGDLLLGIPTCDRFFRAYEDCIRFKVPDERKTEFRVQYEKVTEGLSKAFDGKNQDRIIADCAAAEQKAKAETSAYECAWQ